MEEKRDNFNLLLTALTVLSLIASTTGLVIYIHTKNIEYICYPSGNSSCPFYVVYKEKNYSGFIENYNKTNPTTCILIEHDKTCAKFITHTKSDLPILILTLIFAIVVVLFFLRIIREKCRKKESISFWSAGY